MNASRELADSSPQRNASVQPDGPTEMNSALRHEVTLLTRPGCGSCVRVKEQILPMLMRHGVPLRIIDVEQEGAELRMEFGDRLPVVLLDDEEFACWEVDTEELENAVLN